MKISFFALVMMMSLNVFAVGEGEKGPDCNPQHWTCDNACRERKARDCGISIQESDLTPKHSSRDGIKVPGKSKASKASGM